MTHNQADADMEKAQTHAYAAGRAGDPNINPHAPGVFHDAWNQAYIRGQQAARLDESAAGPGPWGWHGMGYDD